MIAIGEFLVIITIVSAKQVYNGKVKLFNETEPFRNSIFHSISAFSQVPHVIQDYMVTTMNNKMAAIRRKMKYVSNNYTL